MTFVNLYQPPQQPKVLPESELFGPDPYDLNFPFPVHLETLQTERVTLTPFIPSVHAKAYWEVTGPNPELFKFYPFIWQTYEECLTFFELGFRRDPTRILFAIIDKTKPDPAHPEFGGGSLAGVVGLFDTSVPNLYSEIAHVLVFPKFQRTHVTGNAMGALMKYCLNKPTASPPGLGLRRLQWHCHPDNKKSAQLAEKMGMTREGVLRWHRVVSEALKGNGRKAGEDDWFPQKLGRDTLVLSVCWDEWKSGVREKVQGIIDRRI